MMCPIIIASKLCKEVLCNKLFAVAKQLRERMDTCTYSELRGRSGR